MSMIGLYTVAGNLSPVHFRKSLCGDGEIHIQYSPEKGLSRSVQNPESGRSCNIGQLPAPYVPKKLLGQIALPRRFLDLAHFTFQKMEAFEKQLNALADSKKATYAKVQSLKEILT